MAIQRNGFKVVKASGQTEPYDRRKILGSLRRAGADEKTADRVLAKAEKQFHPGISTGKIFGTVMQLLEKEEERMASLYDLKGSIRRLGPAGYSFETYVGEILREYGHSVSLRRTIDGRCARHEIDIVAEMSGGAKPEIRLVECKYHQAAGTLVDLKEMMYTWARLLDINERQGLPRPYDAIMMVSNTRISQEAMRFALCRGLEVISWRYPQGKGLEDLIKARNLYPVTILRNAAPLGPDIFSKAGLMLVKDFPGQDQKELALKLHLPLQRAAAIVREAETVLRENR